MPARYHTCSLLRGLGLDRNVDLDGDCDLSRVLDLEHVIDPVSDRDRDLDLPNALDRTRDLVSAFDRARAGISTLLNDLSRVSIRARDLAVVRQRDDESTRVINLVRDLNLDGNRDSDLAGTVQEQDREGRVAPSAGRLLTAAAKLLPAADRARYAEEYRSELWEIAHAGQPRRRQLHYASRQLVSSWRLRAELRVPRPRKASP